MHPNIHDTDRFAAKHMYCLFSLNIPLFLKCISEDCHHKYTLLKKYKFLYTDAGGYHGQIYTA